MILDWSYNYPDNNMYQQAAPIELYVKKNNTKTNQPYLQLTNNHTYIRVFIHTDN